MVLGFLLYETVDLGINVIKITYNSARSTYYWWYGLDYPEVALEKKAIEDVEKLTHKLEDIEKILKDNKNLQ
jgi:hypothetical protein